MVRLRGRTFGDEANGGDYVGVMALGPSIVHTLPEHGCLFAEVALPHLSKGGKVWALPSPAAWTDLGDLPAYAAANFEWLRVHGTGSWVGDGARVDPAVQLERSLLGAGVDVRGSGLVREVIAWPSARFSAPLSRAVVLASGLVVPFDGTAEN